MIQALSRFEHPQMLDFVRNVAKQDASRAVRARALDLAREMAARKQAPMADEDALRTPALAAKVGAGEPKLNALLIATRNNGASDLHLSVGQPPLLRLASDLVRAQGEPFTAEQTREHAARDPERGAVGAARAGAPARLLPLHPERRPLPRERVPRPAAG